MSTALFEHSPEHALEIVARSNPGLQFSPSLNEIAKALITAQGNMGDVRKSSVNPAFRSKYADLAAVVEAVTPALQTAGIAVVQGASADFDNAGAVVNVETVLLHQSGQWVRSCLALRPTKSDPQGIGSAITYGRRYSLLAMCGVAPEDDDGNAASARNGRSEQPAAHTNGSTKPAAAKDEPAKPQSQPEATPPADAPLDKKQRDEIQKLADKLTPMEVAGILGAITRGAATAVGHLRSQHAREAYVALRDAVKKAQQEVPL